MSGPASHRGRSNAGDAGDDEDENAGSDENMGAVILKTILVVFLGLIVTSACIVSKLTIVSLADSLRHYSNGSNDSSHDILAYRDEQKVAVLYWQLLIILLIPNILTFFRCLFFGMLGKTTENYPWPRYWIAGVVGAIFETIAQSALLFLVLPSLSPGISILILSGVFIIQLPKDLCILCMSLKYHRRTDGYEQISIPNQSDPISNSDPISINVNQPNSNRIPILKKAILAFKSVGFALYLVGGLSSMIVLGIKSEHSISHTIALVLGLFTLSCIWSDCVQEAMAKPRGSTHKSGVNARYKSNLINSFVRIIFYPFVTYVLFRYGGTFDVDPWCRQTDCSVSFSGDGKLVMILHIVMSFVGYLTVWVACTMTLSQWVLGVSLFFSTPVAEVIYYVLNHKDGSLFFELYHENDKFFPYLTICAGVLCLGQLLGMGETFCCNANNILAEDKDMFLTPHYDSVFLEQHLVLNRQVNKTTKESGNSREGGRYIFICSTMYHESPNEMKELLKSLSQVAEHCSSESSSDKYESHIFFDGAISAKNIKGFGLQLLSILRATLSVNIDDEKKTTYEKTPYGYRLRWERIADSKMSFCIHFKDKNLVKAKKRWSQVMYMSYILQHWQTTQASTVSIEDMFILTTDGDVEFKPKSVLVLLDRLESNSKIAGVCARTHPKGQGLLYWYQLFDYAIGHWFQKPAEHILGSVLCSPGCFSIFRCTALAAVLDEYSSEVEGALDFLMKDMGEDRWLCTLLIKKGFRLDYCAISENSTHCPTSFNELYKQRRRWIPSTMANLVTLVLESVSIMKKNDSITSPFIIFQIIMIFSLVISPATVILVLAAGLEVFGIPYEVTVLIFFFLSVLYALVCFYASPKAQLDVSKLLTIVFALVMALVLVGIFRNIVDAIVGEKHKILIDPADCNGFIIGGNKTSEYYNCIAGNNFAANYTNGLAPKPFMLPVPMTVVYIAALSVTFFIASVFHFSEMYCILHSIWFLLGLPSGYLLLVIYSAVNLCDQSWGTREKSSGADEGIWGWRIYVFEAWRMVKSYCLCCHEKAPAFGGEGGETDLEKSSEQGAEQNSGKAMVSGGERGKIDVAKTAEQGTKQSDGEESSSQRSTESIAEIVDLDKNVIEWLTKNECQCYEQEFKRNGYKNMSFIASMTAKDFEEIGINKKGFRLRLEKAAKQYSSFTIIIDIPKDVESWLKDLELSEYIRVFHDHGYKNKEDITNLKELDKEQLKAMGITLKAHLQRFQVALSSMMCPSELEKDKRTAKQVVSNLEEKSLDQLENKFWTNLIKESLQPVPENFNDSQSMIKNSLLDLRRTIVALLLLVNLMWILLLSSFRFWELRVYDIDPRAFNLLFLAVYGFIILIQFFTMLAHRAATFIHYLGRIKSQGCTIFKWCLQELRVQLGCENCFC